MLFISVLLFIISINFDLSIGCIIIVKENYYNMDVKYNRYDSLRKL